MYGSSAINTGKLIIIDTFEILNDKNGIFSFLFRLIQNTLKLKRYDPSIFSSLSDAAVQAKWIALLLEAQQKRSVNASLILSQLILDESNPIKYIKALMLSLPDKLMQKLFAFEHTCSQCNFSDSFLLINKSLQFKQICQKCKAQTNITKLPQIIMLQTGNNTTSLKQKIEGELFYLNSVLTQSNDQRYSIFVDFQGQNGEMFILNDQNRQQSRENQLTYLKSEVVKQYLDQQLSQTTLQLKIGDKVLSCYYNSQEFSESMNSRVQQQFNQTGNENMLSPYSLQQKSQYIRPTSSVLIDFTPQNVEKSVKPQTQPLQQTQFERITGKTVSTRSNTSVDVCTIHWSLYLAMAIVCALMIGCIAGLSIITKKKNTVVVYDNLNLTQQMFVGIDSVTKASDAPTYISLINSLLNPKTSRQPNTPQIKQATVSTFTLYAKQINAVNVTSDDYYYNTSTNYSIQCNDTSILIPSMNISTLYAPIITVNNLTSGSVNTSNMTYNQMSSTTFPNIVNLISANASASIVYPKELNTSNFTAQTVTVTTNLSCPTFSSVSTTTDFYNASNQLTGTNILFTNQNISKQLTSTKNFIFENGYANMTSTTLSSQSNISITQDVSFQTLTLSGNSLTTTVPISCTNSNISTLQVTTGNIINVTSTGQTTTQAAVLTNINAKTQLTTASTTTNAVQTTAADISQIKSQYLNASTAEFLTNQLQVNTITLQSNSIISTGDMSLSTFTGVNCTTVVNKPLSCTQITGDDMTCTNAAITNVSATGAILTGVGATNTTVKSSVVTTGATSGTLSLIMADGTTKAIINSATTTLSSLKTVFMCITDKDGITPCTCP
ncbi:Conserved_hypothetical protein [Hexamita inflata]|uniref:Uncharacterized protein n=1 Tax=Hexamita inflata TaxID=28002 RepID=A0AA86PZN6_9EUKA|nr:Conserved hypothetical protein [Hexamita inflata]